MCAQTCLDLWESLKLESIFWSLYQVKCSLDYMKSRRRGDEILFWPWKFLNGTLLFVLLLFLILGPLWIFSSANPAVLSNNVLSLSAALSIHGPARLYNTFQSDTIVDMRALTDAEYQRLVTSRFVSSISSRDSLQRLTLAPDSDLVWAISPPLYSNLLALCRTGSSSGGSGNSGGGSSGNSGSSSSSGSGGSVRVSFDLSLTRPGPPSRPVIAYSQAAVLTRAQTAQLVAILEGNSTAALELSALFPAFLRLPGTGTTNPHENDSLYSAQAQTV